jgi:spore coat polysaccharide biosynthesis protein SpsF
MKIAAIIQARMTSTRLPGKVLMDIEGRPMLWHMVDRLKYAQKLDGIVLALPDAKESDALENFARQNNIKYSRGSEDDVLARYYESAREFGVNVVVRITSDCPFIDPKVVDEVIARHLVSGADYTSNISERTFPRGLDTEVFNFNVLEQAFGEAKEPYQREHVTPFMREQPKRYKLENVEAKKELAHPEFRLTVDAKEDLELTREIYRHLYVPGQIFYTQEIIDLLERNPEMAKINAHVEQKALKA